MKYFFVMITATPSRDVNNSVMEMLITGYACKTSTARRIIGVIPYLPYSTQCRLGFTQVQSALFLAFTPPHSVITTSFESD